MLVKTSQFVNAWTEATAVTGNYTGFSGFRWMRKLKRSDIRIQDFRLISGRCVRLGRLGVKSTTSQYEHHDGWQDREILESFRKFH